MEIKIIVEDKQVEKLVGTILKAISKNTLNTVIENVTDEKIKEKEVKENKEQVEEKPITLEKVRAVLATKSKNGKQAEVKGLIQRYGVKKLTDIKQSNYKELLELAEVL